MVHYYIDHDDYLPPAASAAGLNEMRERHNYKRKMLYRPLTIVIKPRAIGVVKNYIDSSSTTASAGMFRPKRLDCSADNIPHYGLKLLWTGISTGLAATYSYKMETTYYLKFSGVR